MRLYYVSNTRIPSERASANQIMQMCAAFAEAGADVHLLYPRRRPYGRWASIPDTYAYYGVARSFSMHALPCLDLLKLTTVDVPFLAKTPLALAAHYLQSASFALAASAYVRSRDAGVCYSRDAYTLALLRRRAPSGPMFFEAHSTPQRAWSTRVIRALCHEFTGVITITENLRRYYLAQGMPEEAVLTAPDGVDLRRYHHLPTAAAARARLDLPADRPLLCYTGQLYRWKGVYTLADAMRFLPDTLLCAVGGTGAELAAFQAHLAARGLTNVHCVGQVPPGVVPLYQVAADVLVLPNSAQERISREETSPLKLFEYMAAGRPIVASNLPSLCEVLRHEENAWLVAADDPQALAAGIRHILTTPVLAEHLANQAQADVQQYTWQRRAERILQFMAKRTSMH
jgi:glycosyltransferase involved in cell wall biosynthesis